MSAVVCPDCASWPCQCEAPPFAAVPRPVLAVLGLAAITVIIGCALWACAHPDPRPLTPCFAPVAVFEFDGADDRAAYLVEVSCPVSATEIPMDDHDARR